jgi:hypothetical protein
MKTLKVIVILLLLIPCKAFSQKIISNKKDTLIGYTLIQNDFIIKGLKEWKYYKKANEICDQQNFNNIEIIKSKNFVIKNDSLNLLDFKKVIKNKDEIIYLKDAEIGAITTELNTTNTKLKFQKFYKWTAIIIGSAVTSYITYKYITK